MKITLESPSMQFTLDSQQAAWSLFSRDPGRLSLEGVQMTAAYRIGRSVHQALGSLAAGEFSTSEILTSPHGPLRTITVTLAPDANGVCFSLSFALPEAHPVFLWKLSISNAGLQPVFPERLELLRLEHSGAGSPQSRIHNLKSTDLAFFSNGWQSLTYTGVYGARERFRHSRLGFLYNPMRINPGSLQPKAVGHFASDFFGVLGDRDSRQAVLAGFLSQQQHFGSLEARLQTGQPSLRMWANGDRARLDPGQSIDTDWACLHFLDIDSPDPLAPYLEATARQHGIDLLELSRKDVPVGWCSWYHYFNKITAQDIQDNLLAADQLRPDLPLEVIQIDDGYETRVGDWRSMKPTFREGLSIPARQIADVGFTPGVWLAPFIVTWNSRLARDHPDWLIRGRFNLPANAGAASIFWGSFAAGLDLTHPDALSYTQEVVDTAVNRWGYPYLKLDFLYAAALAGQRRDPTRTRAQVLRAGLEALRQAAGPGTFLLGATCPLGSPIGVLDAMRVEPDVDVGWHPSIFGVHFFVTKEPDFPSARNATHNALARSFIHRRWWINDPDCLLLRPDTRLTLAEVQTLASVIALSGGSLFLSDKLAGLPTERLRIAQALLPLIRQRPRLLDWLDEPTPRRLRLDLENAGGGWHILALFNWKDMPANLVFRLEEFHLPVDRPYHAREYWSGEVGKLMDGSLAMKDVPAHGCRLLALRPALGDRPQYLGSDLHISQGLEIASWEETKDPEEGTARLYLQLERPGRAQGVLDLYLPQAPQAAWLGAEPIQWIWIGESVYRFSVQFLQGAEIRIHYPFG